MPELPEVQTTVSGLDRTVRGLTVTDVWTAYNSRHYHGSDTIKDPGYFKYFKKHVIGAKITHVTRRAKNILIHLSNGYTMLVHMKMTGHMMYGDYDRQDPFNGFIRFIVYFSNGKTMELSDMRKFAKVTLIKTDGLEKNPHLQNLGPEPLEKAFTFAVFKERISKRPTGKIKLVLMDQSIIAGIGNIYADESLWRAGIHPKELVQNLLKKSSEKKLQELYKAIRTTLARGIDFGGDSMSDYRNIDGKRGKFQEQHGAYRRTGKPCARKGCKGTIVRIVLGGRGTHFCSVHQKLLHKTI